MRVVFVNRFFYPDISATSQILTDLAFALAADGHQVMVITGRRAYDDASQVMQSREFIDGVSIMRVPGTGFGRARLVGRALDYLTFYFAAFVYLVWQLKRGDIVIAKTDPPMISVVVAVASRWRGAKLVNWLQDIFPEVATRLGVIRESGLTRLLVWLRNRSLNRAATNVVLGERMADWVGKQGVAPMCIDVIPNWSHGRTIYDLPESENELRRMWALGGRFVVGYSGNLGRAHDVETLYDAMVRLRGHPVITFLFVGGGAGLQALKARLADAHVENVQWQAYQPRERLRESLGAPDAHVVTLRPELEGLIVPSKFYGVIAAGRPTINIGDRDGEIGRLVAAGQLGETIAPGDGAALAALIEHWAATPDVVKALGANGRAFFDQHCDFGHALTAWRRLLARIAADGER
ncbi:MAG: glycosyltransferase family 4 protein [Pseudomonadota bacterium]